MSAYVLVLMTWVGNGAWTISQQEYANMASCQNAAGIITKMVTDKAPTPWPKNKIQWACLPKDNRTN